MSAVELPLWGPKRGGGSPERFEWTVKDLRMEGDGCIQLISFLVTLTDYLQCSVTENLFSLPFKMALPNAQKFYMYESKSTRSLYPDCSDSSGPGIKVERRFTAHIFLLTLWKINYVSHWPKNLNTPYCNFFALSKIQMWSIYFLQNFCCARDSSENWKDGVIIMAQGKRIHK